MSKNIFDYDITIDGIQQLIIDYFGDHLSLSQIEIITSKVMDLIDKDIHFIASLDPSQNSVEVVKNLKTKSLIATLCYRIANVIFYGGYLDKDNNKLTREFMEKVASFTSIDIHPQAIIGEYFFIDHGANVVIGSTTVIGKCCNLFNDVVLGSKNVKTALPVKRHPTLKDNVTICAGCRVLGDITIGNNCFISPNAVVLDDVPDDTHVSIINQLQLSKMGNRLPSQKMIVYGVVPKFKNTIKILGEGFYNPTVLIKLKNDKSLNYTITYWDKNKILIKIKNTTAFDHKSVSGAKIIILSNADKVIITQSFGLTKVLTNLS